MTLATVLAPRRAAVAASAALLLAAAATSGSAAEGEPGPASTATITAASTSGSTLRVVVAPSLAPLPAVEVGTDAVGDGRVPGTDLVRASIEPLGGGRTAFELGLGNLLPAPVTSAPAVLHHNWGFTVLDGTRSTDLVLKAVNRGAVIASAQGQPVDGPSFALQTCSADPSTGQNTCTSSYVDGEYTADSVRFLLDNKALGAVSGARVFPSGQGINVSPGASDALWFTNGAGGDTMTAGEFTVPEGVVKVGVAPAGTPVADVALDAVRDAPAGPVTFTLPRPAAGEHVVVAQACHGGECGPRVSRVVTVS